MKRRRAAHVAIAAAALQAACAAAPAAARAAAPAAAGYRAPSEPRIQSPGDLVLADTGEAKPLDRNFYPRYPAEMRSAGEEAAFAALFVVDTAGRVEYRTISFASEVARPFQRSVCSYLQGTRFTPVMRDGAPRRALGG